jgi:hypothetical protein
MRYWMRCSWLVKLKRRVRLLCSQDWRIWTSWSKGSGDHVYPSNYKRLLLRHGIVNVGLGRYGSFERNPQNYGQATTEEPEMPSADAAVADMVADRDRHGFRLAAKDYHDFWMSFIDPVLP